MLRMHIIILKNFVERDIHIILRSRREIHWVSVREEGALCSALDDAVNVVFLVCSRVLVYSLRQHLTGEIVEVISPEMVLEDEAVAREILLPLVVVGDGFVEIVGEGQLVSLIGAERGYSFGFIVPLGVIAGYGGKHQGKSAVFSELFREGRPKGINVGDDN